METSIVVRSFVDFLRQFFDSNILDFWNCLVFTHWAILPWIVIMSEAIDLSGDGGVLKEILKVSDEKQKQIILWMLPCFAI